MHARAGTLAESSGTRRHAQNGRTADAKNERDVAEHPPKKKKTATMEPRGTQMHSDNGVGNAQSCAKARQLTQKCC